MNVIIHLSPLLERTFWFNKCCLTCDSENQTQDKMPHPAAKKIYKTEGLNSHHPCLKPKTIHVRSTLARVNIISYDNEYELVGTSSTSVEINLFLLRFPTKYNR